MKIADELGFIFFPGPKAIAYLSVFQSLNIVPAVIIVMKNKFHTAPSKTLITSDIKNQYFDLNYSIEQFAKQFSTKVITCEATHINDENLSHIINTHKMNTWLFSGGGIIKPKLLQQGYQFLHMHPGQLSEIKGSTCFYYSLLVNQSLAASAFFMGEELDTGKTIAISQFSVNLEKEALTPTFMDNIIDPWMRSQTLRKVLLNWDIGITEPLINRLMVPSSRPYYVAHPILRTLALLKTSKAFNPEKKKGVIEID